MENVRWKYEEQCRELNMDRDTEEQAWKRYVEVSQRFNLEGDMNHWFCCALYASCRESLIPTVGESNAVVLGNCVSLTKLLRCCNISIYEFLSKIKRWQDMANLTEEFKKQIEILERNFSLTYLMCQHFSKIIQDIFLIPYIDKKSTKFRTTWRCSYRKLCDFCWCLFLCAKNECADHLEHKTLLNLLICCIELIYRNVLFENRTDLINPKFKNVPITWDTQDFKKIGLQKFCIVDKLSALINIAPDEVQNVKNKKWTEILNDFFDSKTIFGNKETFLEIISNVNFEKNLKSLNFLYEQYILNVGAFDERILLNNQSTYYLNSTENETSESNDFSKCILSFSPEIPSTQSKQFMMMHDVNIFNDKLKKLIEIAYAPQLTDFLSNVSEPILQKINKKLADMSKELSLKLGNNTQDKDLVGIITSLYYRLLEKIIQVEINNKPHIDIEIFLDKDAFNTALIVCCVEIVLNSYNFEQTFPWALDCFPIDGFNFFKIIELVVGRHESILHRMHVKHLNEIEECCLESLAWRSSSKIWEIVNTLSTKFPTWAEVDKNNVLKKEEFNSQQQHSVNLNFEPSSMKITDSARKDLFDTTKKDNRKVDDMTTDQVIPNRKIASLAIFLRKFYKIAWNRIKELCKELNMENEIYLNKIWTLFEYSITQRTHLLRDRHLDQIIMCAIYIYIKVAEVENSKFTDIMKAYRKQPQAVSSTYREVLIQSAQQTNKPEYNDLIFFYNKVYVQEMTPYALSFSKKKLKESNLTLSPHPSECKSVPKKIFNHHKIYVSPMEKSKCELSPDSFVYGIGKSPAKELQMMNDVVRRGKRNLPFNDDCLADESPSKFAPPYLPSIATVVKDRLAESFNG